MRCKTDSARCEFDRKEIGRPLRRIWIIKSPVACHPLGIPGALVIGRRIPLRRLLANPKHCRNDIQLPRIPGVSGARHRRRKHPRTTVGRTAGWPACRGMDRALMDAVPLAPPEVTPAADCARTPAGMAARAGTHRSGRDLKEAMGWGNLSVLEILSIFCQKSKIKCRKIRQCITGENYQNEQINPSIPGVGRSKQAVYGTPKPSFCSDSARKKPA
jgi:hypothetical protein